MVSADSLNLDVLELIFAYLSGKDLSAVALVSNSFLAGVIPRLYRTLSFRYHDAKKYPKISTSFSAVLAHPELGVHVRNIDIRIAPMLFGKVNPTFVRDCSRTLELCKNLRSFVYTPDTIPVIIPMLQGKGRLEELRVNAKLTTDQAGMLVKLQKIQRLTLDFASWNTIDLLPKWTESIHKTLTSLTLYMSAELNEGVLESTLRQLPHLRGLHVVSCPKVDHATVLKLTSYTPLLESLSFTATESMRPFDIPPSSLMHLRDIALDMRSGVMADSLASSTFLNILTHLKPIFPPISLFTLKISDLKEATSLLLVQQLLDNHAHTLRKLFFIDCSLGNESVTAICKRCIHLEQLSVPFPMKDLESFTKALAHSATLRTIVDVDAHLNHGTRPSLKQDKVRFMMRTVPRLWKIVSEKRIWMGKRNANGQLVVSFERQSISGPSAHWFMPHTS